MILMGTTNTTNYFKTPSYTLPNTPEVTILLGGRIEAHPSGSNQGLIAWAGDVTLQVFVAGSGNLVVNRPSGTDFNNPGVVASTIGSPTEFILGIHINRDTPSSGYITFAMLGQPIYKSGDINLGSPTTLVDLVLGDRVALDRPLRLGSGINFLSVVAGAFPVSMIEQVMNGKTQLETAPNVVSTFHFISSTQPVFIDESMNTIQSVGSTWGTDFEPTLKASPSPVNSTVSRLSRALSKCLPATSYYRQGDARNKQKPGPFTPSEINKRVNDVKNASSSLTGVFL